MSPALGIDRDHCNRCRFTYAENAIAGAWILVNQYFSPFYPGRVVAGGKKLKRLGGFVNAAATVSRYVKDRSYIETIELYLEISPSEVVTRLVRRSRLLCGSFRPVTGDVLTVNADRKTLEP
ncbi:hypothetical protein OE766_14895 [Pararhizobium sp. YC-54]|uniref:hypothetical protein n=1 Tax=Pararhizobium sp. YC-54 TaxID=2986920 RepID=UPI0021F6E887|nr:hypothetical protein [Pararhizobium sp. YC-54]MCV9999529.1 hypothetical protein [Pararhizobium sp. YC-54]